MKVFKWLASLLIVALIALFIWQNVQSFQMIVPFRLDLFIREPLDWEHFVYTLLALAGALGLLIGMGLMLKPYFKVRRLLAQERTEKQELLDRQEMAAAEKAAPVEPEEPTVALPKPDAAEAPPTNEQPKSVA